MKGFDTTPLETERLILRLWEADDFEAYAGMCAEREVMRFIAVDGKPMSRFDAWRSFSSRIGHWYLRGLGMFAVVERSSGDLAGRIGPWPPEDWPDFELRSTLPPPHWRRGYVNQPAHP